MCIIFLTAPLSLYTKMYANDFLVLTLFSVFHPSRTICKKFFLKWRAGINVAACKPISTMINSFPKNLFNIKLLTKYYSFSICIPSDDEEIKYKIIRFEISCWFAAVISHTGSFRS